VSLPLPCALIPRESNKVPVPHELAIGEVLFPPLLLAALLGLAAALATGRLLNRRQLTELLFYPPLVLVALAVLYTVLIGSVVIGI
jgi:hypothetical protein